MRSVEFRLNADFFESDLSPTEVLGLFPISNEIEGTAGGTEGHTAELRIVVREPVAQAGALRLAGARASATITTLLSLAGAGHGRVGFCVALLDASGDEIGTTPTHVLAPRRSWIATAAAQLDVAWTEGSVRIAWVGEARRACRPRGGGPARRRERWSARPGQEPQRRARAAHRDRD